MRNEKIYFRAVKLLAIASLACVAVLLTDIALLFAEIENMGLLICFILLGGLSGILFLTCFLAEKSRALIIDADKIIFPRGSMVNGKMILKETVIKMCEIKSVESSLYKGDRLISKDTYFHTLKLKDGRNVTVALYTYGKEAEKEFLETVKKNFV